MLTMLGLDHETGASQCLATGAERDGVETAEIVGDRQRRVELRPSAPMSSVANSVSFGAKLFPETRLPSQCPQTRRLTCWEEGRWL